MKVDRRGFMGVAALPLAMAATGVQAQTTAPSRAWAAGGSDKYATVLERLRLYVEQHRAAYGWPGMTLVVVGPDGYTGYITSGWSNIDRREPVEARQLFEVGSISKSITALCVFRAAAAGRLKLGDDVRDHISGLTIDTPERVTLQTLLNHSSGLPDDGPIFPRVTGGKMWLGYKPGSRWSYSNTGYGLLTHVLETLHGQPLEVIVQREVFAPLKLQGAESAVRQEDRTLYPTGYWPTQLSVPFPRGGALTQANFGDELSGAGNVAMATPQMALYLRWLIAAGQGRGAPLLSDAMAKAWATPTVDAPGWAPGAKYANGMAVVQADGRTLLHHTGGMYAFSSSLHLDPQAGVACFASVNVGATGYRPRAITAYACGLFRTAADGSKPPEPKPPEIVVEKPGDYVGAFHAADGEQIAIRQTGKGLELACGDGACLLEPAGDDAFLAHDPRFARYALMVERKDGKPVAVWYGDKEFAADPARLRGPAPTEFATLAGRYDDVLSTSRVVARPTGLFMDGTTPLTRLPDGSWRLGDDDWSPERVWFDQPLSGRPQCMSLSGNDIGRTSDRS